MTTRDEELDKLEHDLRQGIPFIEKPDRVGIANGEACWLDADRVCGAECVAYNWQNIGLEEGVEPQGHQKCVVLSSMAASNAGLVQLVASNRKVVTELQDQRRIAQTQRGGL